VIKLANYHPRVNILQPGPGVGGHCIAVDPWFIVAQAPERARLIRTAREVNDGKPHWVIDKVGEMLGDNPAARVACLGLTFKPNVDDFRESPSLEIARELTRRYPGQVVCADPFQDMLRDPGDLNLIDVASAQKQADVIVMLVGHEKFRSLPRPAEGEAVIDACGFWK